MKFAFRAVAGVLGIVATGILATVVVVWVYSTLVAPGQSVKTYEAFAQKAGPWVSVLLGPMISYFGVRLATKGMESPQKLAGTIFGLYATFDVLVLVASKAPVGVWGFALVSLVGRAGATWLAVRDR